MAVELQSPAMAEWKSYPQTQTFLDWLRQEIQAQQEQWSNNELTRPTMDEWAMLDAAARGSVRCKLEIIRAIEDINTGGKDD